MPMLAIALALAALCLALGFGLLVRPSSLSRSHHQHLISGHPRRWRG